RRGHGGHGSHRRRAGRPAGRRGGALPRAGWPRPSPSRPGELRVYERGDYACAVTLAKRPGARRSMSVSLQPRGGRAATDSGRFTRQAGPVTVHALNRCVRATGSVSGTSRSTGWILC
ncbi:secreted protein, partial [Streptomyces pristinaespiralis ATCC 25486]